MNLKDIFKNMGICLFPFTLPLPLNLKFKSIALGIFLITVLVMNIKFRSIHMAPRNHISVILAFCSFFLLENLFGLYRLESLHEVRLSFFLIPLSYLISGEKWVSQVNLILQSFLLGVYTYVLCVFIYIIYFYGFYSENASFGFDYYLKYVTYHYFPGAIHHTYMGLFLCFSIVLLLFVFKLKTRHQLIALLPILLSIPFLASKLSIIISVLILLFWIAQKTKVDRKKQVWYIVPIVLLNIILFFFTDLFRTISISIEKRVSYVECVFSGFDGIWLGVGREKVKDFMMNCPQMGERMDAHNIFLQEFVSWGFIGIGALTTLFALLFLKAKTLIFRSILILTLLYGLVEHLFNTQLGVTFFVFFVFVLLSKNERDNKAIQ